MMNLSLCRKLILRFMMSGILIGLCYSRTQAQEMTHNDSLAIVREILAVQVDHAKAWNTGNVDAFLEYYWQNDSVRFVSGGTVLYGISALRERYKKNYPDKAAMGVLNFTELSIMVMSKKSAVVHGRYNLVRDSSNRTGLFTLLMKKIRGKWFIVHDHTSTA